MAMNLNSRINLLRNQEQKKSQAIGILVSEISRNKVSEDEIELSEPSLDAEDADDSRYLYQERDESNLDYEVKYETPPFHQLLARLQLPVQFHINADFEIRDLLIGGWEASSFRKKIVLGIVNHLRSNNCILRDPGNWIHIPAIKSDDDLTALAEENPAEQKQLKDRLKSFGRFYKSFAILLPNLDLVTPQALISPARHTHGIRTTAAAGLKVAHDLQPSELSKWKVITIAGEEWSGEDLLKFYKRHKSKAK